MSWRHRDHTRGSLVKSIGVLALPTILGGLAGGVVFQLVELAFLSRLGDAPMAAVIIVNQSLRQLFRVPILAFFSDDPEVIRIGADYLRYASGAFAMWAFFFVFMRTLQGAGEVIPPMLISLGTTLAFTLPLSTFLARHTELGPTGIWIAFLASSVVSTVGTGLWLATGRWTRARAHSVPLLEG